MNLATLRSVLAPIRQGLETVNNNVVHAAGANTIDHARQEGHLTAIRSDVAAIKASMAKPKKKRAKPGSHPVFNHIPVYPETRLAFERHYGKRFCVIPYQLPNGKMSLAIEGLIQGNKRPKLVSP